MNDTPSRNLITIIGLATATLIALSALPLSKLTGNILKDFDLFEDLFPAEYTVVFESDVVAPDPELSLFLAETTEKKDTELSAGSEGAEETAAVPSATESSSQQPESTSQNYTFIAGDIENYGESNSLAKLRTALSQSSSKQVRIAVAGDSFIEGDILTQDLRELFQNRYGGSGVGFMAMHSDFPGFRKTVRQTDKGWTMRDVRTMRSSDTIRALSGDYAISNGKASTTYKGVDRSEHTSQWTRSSAMFIAPNGGSVRLGIDGISQDFALPASREVQSVALNGATSKFRIETSTPGIIALGAFLDSDAGVQVDCMSVRGNTGINHRKLNSSLTASMRANIDYDLIIMEYGVNALSAEQSDYTAYMQALTASANRIKEVCPNADIILMGIADRGHKEGGVVRSLRTCDAMVKAQREAARRCGIHFWDTRAAMGGADACSDWRKRSLMNADYTHLNHKGGGELARLLFDAITKVLDE